MKQATHSDERHAAGVIVRYARQHWPELCPTDAKVYRGHWYVQTATGWYTLNELRDGHMHDVDQTIAALDEKFVRVVGEIKQLLHIEGESI